MQEKTGFPGLEHVTGFSTFCSWEDDIIFVPINKGKKPQKSPTSVLHKLHKTTLSQVFYVKNIFRYFYIKLLQVKFSN